MNTTTTVYIDDFDPILSYANPLDWTTPDPSENPSWYRDADVTEYHQATWHHTSVSNASLSLNFTGTSRSQLESFMGASRQVSAARGSRESRRGVRSAFLPILLCTLLARCSSELVRATIDRLPYPLCHI
jgi:hypothetical protein